MANDRDLNSETSESSATNAVRRQITRQQILLVIALVLGAAWLGVFLLNLSTDLADSLPDATGFPTHDNLERLIRRDAGTANIVTGFRTSQTTASAEWVVQEFQTETRPAAETLALVDRFMQAVLDDLQARGCDVHSKGMTGPGGGLPLFTIRYSRGAILGGIEVNSFPDVAAKTTISCYAYEHLR